MKKKKNIRYLFQVLDGVHEILDDLASSIADQETHSESLDDDISGQDKNLKRLNRRLKVLEGSDEDVVEVSNDELFGKPDDLGKTVTVQRIHDRLNALDTVVERLGNATEEMVEIPKSVCEMPSGQACRLVISYIQQAGCSLSIAQGLLACCVPEKMREAYLTVLVSLADEERVVEKETADVQ